MGSMIRGIDHLVIACADPAAAAVELESGIGLAATGGGRHEGAGTYNRIAWLADGSYLELVGIEDRAAAASAHALSDVLFPILDRGGGLAAYALADDDIETTVEALRAAGSAIGPVTHGSRRRDDGELVEWWMAHPPPELARRGLPFLIQHAYAGSEWGSLALADRATFRHPIGSPVVLARIDLATDDPPGLAALYHEHLGLEFWAVADLAVGGIGRHTVRLVPTRAIDAPAAVTLGADVDGPRTMDALGVRFDVERVELPLIAPSRT
jgi:Glyoxalase-like domain